MKIILQKFIADTGYCSRRKAEDLIRSGKVSVDKKKAELGMRVDEENEIIISGKKIKKDFDRVYIILNKPEGYTCTSKKFKGEKNVFDLVKTNKRLFIVGRLDKNSQGLVLLTNDGDLAQELTHPSFEHEKKYVVEIEKTKFNQLEIINNFKKGVDIGKSDFGGGIKSDGIVWAKNIKYLGGTRFEIVLTEGKKRQIRRMFQTQNLEIKKLKRVSLGKLRLGELKPGQSRNINKNQII